MRRSSPPIYNKLTAPATGSKVVAYPSRSNQSHDSAALYPRPRRRYRLLAWLVSAVFAALLLVWVPVAEVWAALTAVAWGWLALAAAPTFVNLLLRGVRWAVILGRRGPGELASSIYQCAIAVGFNAVIPGKVGELVRIGLAARHLRLRLGRVLAAAMAERLIDMLVLLVLVAVPLSQVQTPAGTESSQLVAGLHRLARTLAWASLLAAGVLMSLGHAGLNRRVRGAVFGLTRARFPGLARALHRSLCELRRALVYAASPARLAGVLGLTLIMWLALGCGVYVAAWGSAAVELSLPLAVAFAAVTVLAAALPSAPGAWGVFEAAGVVFVLGLTAAEDRAAVLAFVIAVHLIQYLPVVLAAALSWVLLERNRGVTAPAGSP